jgi:hypothetical protein
VDNRIHYLNTDLDVWSPVNLTDLATGLAANGVNSLHVTELDNETWYATFEADDCFDEPEETIAALLAAIEALPPMMRDVWTSCTRREFNIGYDCGDEPWEFNQLLSSGLLERLVRMGGSIRITLYPDRSDGR